MAMAVEPVPAVEEAPRAAAQEAGAKEAPPAVEPAEGAHARRRAPVPQAGRRAAQARRAAAGLGAAGPPSKGPSLAEIHGGGASG